MRYIADLHIHSPYSRATSKSSNLPGLAAWSAVKGIDVIGTGDFTHPGWFRELRENLDPAEPGFYRLKDIAIPGIFESVPADRAGKCRFVLTAEISSIYKRHDRVRKVHCILFVPDFESASRINARLASIGNIESDGRPILGLDAHDLLEIVLEAAPDGFLVPAHIWTPWFSLFGSKSGFDSIEECFGDLSSHIFALETGLSSDPEMNRMVSALDRYTLISNSDCHSPAKLGREANIFTCGFNYFSMRDALKNPAVGGFEGTVEFFPEEGKYHHDGHRKCGINLDPLETRKIGGICPVCSKPLTIGVMHRVLELADRESPSFPPNSPRYYSLIPLAEVLGEIFSRGPATKTVLNEYARLTRLFGSEFNLLLNVPVGDISENYSPVLAEAIARIRRGKVIRRAGFDGEFGVIKVFEKGELQELTGQHALFSKEKKKKKPLHKSKPRLLEFAASEPKAPSSDSRKSLNVEQATAVTAEAEHMVVIAGPGTGKTFTLVSRIEHLIRDKNADAGRIAAITFTNRAAEEMRERLGASSGIDAGKMFIGTFHSFCLQFIRQGNRNLTVIGEPSREKVIRNLFTGLAAQELEEIKEGIVLYYELLNSGNGKSGSDVDNHRVAAYFNEIKSRGGIDLDGVIPMTVHRLRTEADFLDKVRAKVQYLFIDEFQDMNSSQYELVRLLAGNSSVFAIGDPDQAIYGFRGSSPEFFHRFIDEFNAQTITLQRNYRSPSRIIQAASEVILNNYESGTDHYAELIPETENPGSIEVFRAPSPQAEAEFVVRRIEEMMGGISHFSMDSGRSNSSDELQERSFRDFCVLYRLTQQADFLREALERRGIPFQVVNVTPFYMHREVKPLYCWIRAAGADQDSSEAQVYLELLRVLPGIGDSTLLKLEKQLPFGGFADFFKLAAEINLPGSVRERIDEVEDKLKLFADRVAAEGLAAAVADVIGFLRVNAKTEGVKRFLELAGSFGSDLSGFASYLHKNEAATVYDENAEAVSLMTLHGAKGLEFPVVFITGMEEGVFPGHLSVKGRERESADDGMLSEERRLFYVGMTRAGDSLILTSSVTRTIFGKYQSREVSRFIDEVPRTLYEQVKQEKTRKKKAGSRQMKLF